MNHQDDTVRALRWIIDRSSLKSLLGNEEITCPQPPEHRWKTSALRKTDIKGYGQSKERLLPAGRIRDRRRGGSRRGRTMISSNSTWTIRSTREKWSQIGWIQGLMDKGESWRMRLDRYMGAGLWKTLQQQASWGNARVSIQGSDMLRAVFQEK